MVEKKTVAIAVLCVVTVLCLGLWANEAQEANRLEGELSELEDDYDNLARVRTSLEENYSELRTEKEDLEEEYSNLEADVTSLEKSYLTLQTESRDLILAIQETNSLLMSNYSTLKTYYSTLYSNYNSLKEDYDELNALFEEGEAIAESAEWITEDECLKVTSKLITSGTYWVTYTVRVTIVNIGDEPMDEVWIFLFPYVDGKIEYWSIYSHVHSVESIYIGETYSHDFTYLPDEMTSYKVLAVVG